jgi:hypothetical protein
VGQAGEDPGDAARLHHVDLAGHCGRDLGLRADVGQTADRVEHGDARRGLVQQPFDAGEVALEAERGGPLAPQPQQPRAHPAAEVDADRSHVAHELVGGLLEGHEQGGFPAGAGGVGRGGRQRRLPGAGAPGDEHRGAAVDTTGQHLVQPGHAQGDAIGGDRVGELGRGDGPDHQTAIGDQEGVLVGAVAGSAVLHDA